METITHLPVKFIGNHYYVNCRNRAMGWGKMNKGRTVKKCKVSCSHFRDFTDDHQLLCAWHGHNITVDPISTNLKGGDRQ